MFLNYIKTLNSITLIFDKAAPVNVLCTNPIFGKVKAALDKGRFDSIETILKGGNGVLPVGKIGKFFVDENGNILIDNTILPKTLSERLIKFVELDLDTVALENFWSNLSQNPSEDSKKDLFLFLEVNHIPLTQDGCFIGYKKVTDDFLDCHTRKISNKVGDVVKMPRDKVNGDRNQTCSFGLHVAAFEYARNFSSGTLVEVKVNPKDVVSVPIDYNSQKMRVCEYTVLAIHEGEEIKDDLFGVKSPANEVFEEVTIPTMASKKSQYHTLKVGSDGRISVPFELLTEIDCGGDLSVRTTVAGQIIVSGSPAKHVTSEWNAGWEGNGGIRIPKSLSDVVTQSLYPGENPTAIIVNKEIVIE